MIALTAMRISRLAAVLVIAACSGAAFAADTPGGRYSLTSAVSGDEGRM